MKKRSYSKRRNPRRKDGCKVKPILAVLLPVAAIAVGGYVMHGELNNEKPDSDYCYVREDQHQHKTAIFVDNSLGRLSDAHLRDYRAAFERAYDNAPPNTKIMIYTTAKDKSGTVVTPSFSLCKPPSTPAQQEAMGISSPQTAPYLTRQAQEARRRYHGMTMRTLADTQDETQHAGDSPLLEQLRAISRAPSFQGKTRSLIVITDGVQNSDIAHFCVVQDDMPHFQSFAEREDYALAVKPRSFSGTAVSLLLTEGTAMPNASLPYCSSQELRQWWVDYFNDNGADNVELTVLRDWAGQ